MCICFHHLVSTLFKSCLHNIQLPLLYLHKWLVFAVTLSPGCQIRDFLSTRVAEHSSWGGLSYLDAFSSFPQAMHISHEYGIVFLGYVPVATTFYCIGHNLYYQLLRKWKMNPSMTSFQDVACSYLMCKIFARFFKFKDWSFEILGFLIDLLQSNQSSSDYLVTMLGYTTHLLVYMLQTSTYKFYDLILNVYLTEWKMLYLIPVSSKDSTWSISLFPLSIHMWTHRCRSTKIAFGLRNSRAIANVYKTRLAHLLMYSAHK